MTSDDAGFFALMIADSAAKRAMHYRSEGDRLRKMAEAEPNPRLRQNLLELVEQYADLAASLDPAASRVTHVKFRQKDASPGTR